MLRSLEMLRVEYPVVFRSFVFHQLVAFFHVRVHSCLCIFFADEIDGELRIDALVHIHNAPGVIWYITAKPYEMEDFWNHIYIIYFVIRAWRL